MLLLAGAPGLVAAFAGPLTVPGITG